MSHLCSRLIISLPAHLILLAGILLQTTHEHWVIGLAFSAFCIVVLLVLHALRRVTEKAWFQERQSSARFFGFLEKHLADLAGHRERGAHGNVMQSFIHYASTLFHAGRRAHIMGNLQVLLIVEPLFFLAKVAMFLLAAYFFKTGVMTIGTVFLIDSYTNMLHHHLGAIGQLFQDFQQAGASITRIRMLFETKPALRESAITHQLREVQV
jgi:ATP-binding cassette, subfamily B, bacterial